MAWLMNERWKRGEIRREIKRRACLDALRIVDCFYSNLTWNGINSTERQPPPDIQRAREVYNELCVTCDGYEVLEAYKACLGFRGKPNIGSVVDLRNAIRKEIGFGNPVDHDREYAWIARLNNPNDEKNGKLRPARESKTVSRISNDRRTQGRKAYIQPPVARRVG